jgi:hypothetical protein
MKERKFDNRIPHIPFNNSGIGLLEPHHLIEPFPLQWLPYTRLSNASNLPPGQKYPNPLKSYENMYAISLSEAAW